MALVGDLLLRQQFQPVEQGGGLGAAVGLHHPYQEILPVAPALGGLLEHGVGLPDARRGAQEDLQPGPGRPVFLLLQVPEEFVGVRSAGFHPKRLPTKAA